MSDQPESLYAFPHMTKQMRSDFYGTDAPLMPLTYGGMTLRDYFAAKAMQGRVSDMETAVHAARFSSFKSVADFIANDAYTMADAMLKARRS